MDHRGTPMEIGATPGLVVSGRGTASIKRAYARGAEGQPVPRRNTLLAAQRR